MSETTHLDGYETIEPTTSPAGGRSSLGRMHGFRVGKLPLPLILGAVLVGAFILIALVSFVWTPHDPTAMVVADRLLPPGSDGYLFGTDKFGRDVVSQLMVGARNSLFVSLLSTSVALVIGALLGLLTAGAGPRWRNLLSRLVDAGVALPGILIALVLATSTGPGNRAAIVAIIVWFIPTVARVTIGPARQILALDFVEAAYAYGRSRWYVLLHHVTPNIGPLLIVLGSVMFAAAILIEAALAFLGVGAQPPTASWGRLLQESQPLLEAAPALMFFPGVAIVLTVLGFNLLGDGLRTLLDPQQATRNAGLL
ncbi:MAG TPA: ABC transporter permease [Acidimicrobiia bacterium]|nr:ABC transporter permease [Acidimicrobiia bacterium]